ncbi:hypothetical protein [Streptomyces sp. NPDC096132]|uniref:hypothetical protein n=1 Tax=Streptomyces sp. NPDC096132 TaxID=3366075 RepID=UPI0037F57CB9
MTEPTQPGPYTGQPAPAPQTAAAASGWPAPPPQQGGHSPYPAIPPTGYGRPPGPPTDPGTVSDRVSGALLLLGAALTVGGSFVALDESKEYLDGDKKEAYKAVAKAWSFTTTIPGEKAHSVTQLDGIPLLVGSLVAVVAAVLLLSGAGRRLPAVRALGVAGAVLLFGTTMTVAMSAVSDTQWDTDSRSTTFGPGFYLLLCACLLTLGATVLTALGTRRPAVAGPGPTHPPQSWPTGQVPQPYPSAAQPYPSAAQPYPPAAQPYPPAQPPSPPSHQPPPSAG